jgi:hypothetical protein
MRACGWPSQAQATAVSPCRRCLASLPLRAPEHPLPHGTRGHLSGMGQGRYTSSRDMAFPSACPRGTSRGLHPRAPLPLLYPSLCRMSSPSNRRAAPRPAVLRAALASLCPPYAAGSSTETPFPRSAACRASRRHYCWPAASASSAKTSARTSLAHSQRQRIKGSRQQRYQNLR